MISIIIPAFNEEKTIEATIKQFDSSLPVPYEIIVTDGGSLDRTVDAVKRCSCTLLIHPIEKQQTIASNRNNGAAHAKGDILMFVDSGCNLVEPAKFVTKALSHFEKDGHLVALTASLKVSPPLETFADKIVYIVMNKCLYILNNKLGKGAAQGKFQMVRKSAFEKCKGYREDLAASEDMELFSRLSKIGRTMIDTDLVVYHPGRRAHAIGWPRLLYIWNRDALSLILRGKIISKVWPSIR